MLNFTVPDMSCDGCVKAITVAVRAVDAGADVTADLAAKTVAIRSGSSSASLAAAIRDAGFEVAAAA